MLTITSKGKSQILNIEHKILPDNKYFTPQISDLAVTQWSFGYGFIMGYFWHSQHLVMVRKRLCSGLIEINLTVTSNTTSLFTFKQNYAHHPPVPPLCILVFVKNVTEYVALEHHPPTDYVPYKKIVGVAV